MRFEKYNQRKEILVESVYLAEGLTHMEHLEDNVVNKGTKGLEQNVKIIRSIIDKLNGSAESNTKFSLKWDGCIHPDTVILTDQGDMKIRDILGKNDISVLSYNISAGVTEMNLAIRPRVNHNNKKWVEVEMENGEKLKVTEDHQFYTTNRGWVEAKNLTEDDDIKEISSIDNLCYCSRLCNSIKREQSSDEFINSDIYKRLVEYENKKDN